MERCLIDEFSGIILKSRVISPLSRALKSDGQPWIRTGDQRMHPTNVLLIDDEEAFLGAIKRRLEKRGLKIKQALSGQEGIRALHDNPDTDVVILDVKMPGMDGIQTLREIKRLFPIVEVIMLTAHGTIETAIEGMNLGAFDFLMKPCEMGDLMAKVEQARRRRQEHQQRIAEATDKELSKQ
jgi:DNA-binding NtrC family response regulator